MRHTIGPWLAATIAGTLLGSCMDCNREGCDALGEASGRSGTGIAGVVAQSSDVVDNGCQECPLGDATLRLWRVETAVADDVAALAVTKERNPDVTVEASQHYDRELVAGSYLLCENTNCIGVDIIDGEKLTVNVKRRYGPTSFFVGGGHAGSFGEDFGFVIAE